MIKSIGADECITHNAVTLTEETDLFEAIHMLLKHKVSGATVINGNNEVIGILSELDCLKAILDGSYYGDVGGTVGQYMTREVQSIENIDTMDILQVAKLMIDGSRRRIPVVKDGKFSGQVSCRSVLQAVKDFVAKHDPTENSQYE
jgi:CBS domain-containing protein